MNPRSSVLPQAVDGVEGEFNIAEKWKNEFKSRFNGLEKSQPGDLHSQQCYYEPVSLEQVAVFS